VVVPHADLVVDHEDLLHRLVDGAVLAAFDEGGVVRAGVEVAGDGDHLAVADEREDRTVDVGLERAVRRVDHGGALGVGGVAARLRRRRALEEVATDEGEDAGRHDDGQQLEVGGAVVRLDVVFGDGGAHGFLLGKVRAIRAIAL